MSMFKSALTIVGALFLFCIGVWSVVWAETPLAQGSGYLTLAVLDVGQGDSLYIEGPTGVQVLVDGGPGGAVLRALPAVMPVGDRTIDALVETHPDADHIGGFAEIVERYEVGAFITPNISKSTATFRTLRSALVEHDVPVVVARRGMTIELGGGAVLEVLYPEHDVSQLRESEANEGGVVMRLRYGRASAILMADVGSGVERRVMVLDELRSDVLKVGHHGSRFSTHDVFVKEVSPEFAIISVGKNSYGHPTPEALGMLERAGARIFRTDQNGTVLCTSDGAVFVCN